MSATNRGAKRKASDFYPTPPGPLASLVPWWDRMYRGGAAYEPAAGDGAILRWLADRGLGRDELWANDVVMSDERRAILDGWSSRVTQGDYLTDELAPHRARLVITNPPFRQAQAFCERAIETCDPAGVVVMLMRLSMLGSTKRRAWWATAPLARVGVITPRPSFTGHGNDACEYAWFLFEPLHRGPAVIEVLRA